MAHPDNPLYGISIKEIARICQVDLTTARRWKRGARCPPKSALLLILGDLGAFGNEWRGWIIREDKLISPEGWEIKAGEVLAVPLMRQQIAVYQSELRQIAARVLMMQEQPTADEWPEWIANISA
jgi:hypothetical protein